MNDSERIRPMALDGKAAGRMTALRVEGWLRAVIRGCDENVLAAHSGKAQSCPAVRTWHEARDEALRAPGRLLLRFQGGEEFLVSVEPVSLQRAAEKAPADPRCADWAREAVRDTGWSRLDMGSGDYSVCDLSAHGLRGFVTVARLGDAGEALTWAGFVDRTDRSGQRSRRMTFTERNNYPTEALARAAVEEALVREMCGDRAAEMGRQSHV